MNHYKVLIVDDEPDICELLSITISRMGLSYCIATNLKEAIEQVTANDFSLILSDMRLPDGEGFSLVQYVQKHKPQIPIAIITAFGNVEGAVNTLKAGAFDYVSKPVNIALLKKLVNTALAMNAPVSIINAQDELLIGDSAVMLSLKESINKLARSMAPVYIQGESGVGKELVAQRIHKNGPREQGAFIPVNCGAVPTELLESEFFGHIKGSFTGATADKDGLFVAASGGTLFLDEIAELPINMQVKLLRAIQEKAVKPIGAAHEIPIDVRILSASHKSLKQEIEQGSFRKDLYYRLNVIELEVPPLRERISDVPKLTHHILNKISQQHPVNISKAAIEKLQSYHFPGNVRELENILERAIAMSEGNTLNPDDIDMPNSINERQELNDSPNLTENLMEHEKNLILDALEKTKWNRTAAAKILGVSFRTLRYRLKKMGID